MRLAPSISHSATALISALGIAPELDRFYTEAQITWLSQCGERLVIEVTPFHRTQEMQHSPMTRTRERARLLG